MFSNTFLSFFRTIYLSFFHLLIIVSFCNTIPLDIYTIIYRRPVLCKLLAKDSERIALAARLDIPELIYLAANITLTRDDPTSITVSGKLEAHIKAGQYLAAEIIVSDFDTLILDNLGGKVISTYYFQFFLR